LRRYRESDIETIAWLCNDVAVGRNMRDRFPSPYTVEHARTFVRDLADPTKGPGMGDIYAITVDDVMVGGSGLHPKIAEERVSMEFGYFLGRAYWGRQIMTTALRQVVAKVWADYPSVQRLQAMVFS
jgi:RimJ/RimL family protein N-acetyltransferase